MKPPGDQPAPNILVVDDESIVVNALKSSLERDGHRVTATTSPLKALELLRRDDYAVIISDHRMPEMTGLDFLIESRKIRPHASRILITAVLSLPTIVEAINKGEIFRFVAKPWLREELSATIQNALQRHHLVTDNERLSAEAQELNARLMVANSSLAARVKDLEQKTTALDKANRELATSYDHSLDLCRRILATYDPYLGGRTKAVVDIAQCMAGTEHFTEPERHALRTGAWLCDLGLIGIPRELLRSYRLNPARLSEHERESIQTHPIYSQTLASYVDPSPLVAETIRAHHERFDGEGYPDGLSELSIPWPARCLALAVWFVESGLTKEKAIDAIMQESGKAFDPEAVRLFLKVTHLVQLPRQMREIMLDELEPGMVLATGLYSPHGLLLIGEGQALSASTIAKIRNHNLISVISQRLLVYS
jgi:response regulator RpfG family c-di-GMP phosphodiesterase